MGLLLARALLLPVACEDTLACIRKSITPTATHVSCVYQAQRLTALEKLFKKATLQPQGSGHIAGAVAGKGTDERLLRRLGSDLALVKRRLDEIAPPKDPGALMMMREGDHAMLAGKPLQGYR